jgi:hypothetical protein
LTLLPESTSPLPKLLWRKSVAIGFIQTSAAYHQQISLQKFNFWREIIELLDVFSVVPANNSIWMSMIVGINPDSVNSPSVLRDNAAFEEDSPHLLIKRENFWRRPRHRNRSRGRFLWMHEFKRLCARIDDEARLLRGPQRFCPCAAAAQPCHRESPSQAKDGTVRHGNIENKKTTGAEANAHS